MNADELQARVDSAIGDMADDPDSDVTRENTFVGEPMTVSEFAEMMKEMKDEFGEDPDA